LPEQAAIELIALLGRQRISSGLVVDLGCGGGVLASRLSKAGFDVVGIDLSLAMLRLARNRAPRARFERKSLFSAKLPPKCAAITAVGEAVNYLQKTSSKSSIVRLTRLFGRVHRALVPGGIFLLDVAGPGRTSGGSLVRSQGGDWAILASKEENRRSRILTLKMTMFRKVGRLYRPTEEVHRQRLYSPVEITRLLEAAGFKIRRLPAYGNLRFGERHTGFPPNKL
jgi:SAM-dependent methyltransferase